MHYCMRPFYFLLPYSYPLSEGPSFCPEPHSIAERKCFFSTNPFPILFLKTTKP